MLILKKICYLTLEILILLHYKIRNLFLISIYIMNYINIFYTLN